MKQELHAIRDIPQGPRAVSVTYSIVLYRVKVFYGPWGPFFDVLVSKKESTSIQSWAFMFRLSSEAAYI